MTILFIFLGRAKAVLNPVNSSNLEPSKNQTLEDFVTRVYFVNMEGQKRASTLKGYKARWDSQLKARGGHFRLKEFRTPQAHQVLAEIGREHPELTRSTLHHFRSLLSATSGMRFSKAT